MIGRFFESFTKLMFQMGRHTSISGPSSVTQWIVHYTMLVSRRWYFLVAVSLLLQAAFSSSSSLTTTVRYRPQRLYRAPSRTRTISLRLPRLVAPTRALQRLHWRASANDLVIAGLASVYAVQVAVHPRATLWLMKSNEALAGGRWLRRGQAYRLATCVFAHGSVPHLAANSFSLANIGPACEQWFGKPRYLSAFMVTGVTGSLASWRFTAAPSLGASGAVYGLLGAWTSK